MRKPLLTLALLSVMSAPVFAAPQQSDHERIATLEAQLSALQAEIQAMKTGKAAPVAAESTVASATDEIDALAADAPDSGASVGDTSAMSVAASDLASASGNSGGSNPNAFNPAISIILNGSYSHHSLDADSYARAGFPVVGEGGPGPNGFSLGESELALSANIDDKFYGQVTLAIGSDDGADEVGIEEAFIDTTSLPGGLSVRAGRFFSNLGYLNSHHTHTDNFFDRPLAYQAFLGGQYDDDGVQLRWLAPTSMFVEVGGEVFRGQSFPSAGS
ncbi:MAG: hypothetical protein ABIP16_04455, partial [Thermomonas sp.]